MDLFFRLGEISLDLEEVEVEFLMVQGSVVISNGRSTRIGGGSKR